MFTFEKQKTIKMYRLDLSQVPIGKIKQVKAEVMAILKITTYPGLRPYLQGTREPGISEAEKVEQHLSSKYGITDVWANN